MKRGQILGILALLLVCVVTVIPAMAVVPITHDAATDYYNAAVQLTANGDYAGAIALYDKALSSNTTMMNRTDALLYTFQGKSYAQIQLGNYTDVIVTVDTGLEKFPTDPMLWNNKGYAQYSLGKYADAVTSYDRALASDGNNTLALSNKGDALVKLGNYQDAIMTYKAALENDPDNNATATKLADAEKAAASTLPVTLIVLVVVVIIAAAGVTYYVTRKIRDSSKKATDTPDKKTGTKKNKK
ncbi:tetratricopeptide repeat protein [Methanoregula sp.]|jgi:tetratricopeptide (TPR) repeat protein|uniref:tetratricopeptide repeat protein n=1 Tax=Methanoregula sp. TaxID=2052170 RepID=UPI0025ED3A6E|nr:tetratricopeptide repeat protein [Methanoregula sp.]